MAQTTIGSLVPLLPIFILSSVSMLAGTNRHPSSEVQQQKNINKKIASLACLLWAFIVSVSTGFDTPVAECQSSDSDSSDSDSSKKYPCFDGVYRVGKGSYAKLLKPNALPTELHTHFYFGLGKFG